MKNLILMYRIIKSQRTMIMHGISKLFITFYCITLYHTLHSMDQAAIAQENIKNARNLNTAICIGECLQTGIIDCNREPSLKIPTWPKGVANKCRTIKQFADGPFKGKQAKIIRSLWSMCGINTIFPDNEKNSNNIFVVGKQMPMLLRFFTEVEFTDPAAVTPLYCGKIAIEDGHGKTTDRSTIIPESWLSKDDIDNLANFHHWELSVLGEQLFDTKSNVADNVLGGKINEEIQRHLPKNRFLEAVFLEALKYGDRDVLFKLLPNIKNNLEFMQEAYDLILMAEFKSDANKETIAQIAHEIEQIRKMQ